MARHVHVGSALGEGNGDEVGADFGGRFDVVHVFCRERRRREPAALAVDPLVVGENPAVTNCRMNLRANHAQDFQDDSSVVEQQDVACAQIVR